MVVKSQILKNENDKYYSNIALHWDLWPNCDPLKSSTQVKCYKTFYKNKFPGVRGLIFQPGCNKKATLAKLRKNYPMIKF